MKRFAAVVVCICLTHVSAFAADPYAVCGRIIDQGLRNYDISTSSETTFNTVFDNYCNADGSRKSTNAGLGIDLVVKTIPVSLRGNFGSDEEQMSQFCRNYASTYQRTSANRSYKNTIVAKGYEAFNQCIRFVALGVSVEHNVVSPAMTSFFFSAGVGRPIEIRGVAIGSNKVACSGQKPDGTLIQYTPNIRISTAETIGFTCQRTPEHQNDGSDLFKEATISITTNVGNYDVFLPNDTRLADNSASSIATQLTDLRTAVTKTNDRIKNIKLMEGDRTTLPEFACGGEAIATDKLTFMVGSKDGTGCEIKNRNYVKALKLSIPDEQ